MYAIIAPGEWHWLYIAYNECMNPLAQRKLDKRTLNFGTQAKCKGGFD